MGNIGPMEVIMLGAWLGVAWLVGNYAKTKGYSFGLFFVAALFTWLIAAVIVFFLPRQSAETPAA
jgi:hypothetical protein